jgi:hypothetical protein
MFEYAYDLSGNAFPVIKEFPIAAATAVVKGSIVRLSGGFVDNVDADQDDPYLGVAAEAHDGSTAGRQSGTVIKVYCSPTAVFKVKNKYEVVADSGNATTLVDASYGTAGDDQFNGGVLKLSAKGTGSTLTLPVGKLVAVTDFATTTGTFTGTFTGNTTAGDTYLVFPPVGSYCWDVDAAADDFDFNTTGGESLIIVENDMVNDYIMFKFRLHQFGAGVAAI